MCILWIKVTLWTRRIATVGTGRLLQMYSCSGVWLIGWMMWFGETKIKQLFLGFKPVILHSPTKARVQFKPDRWPLARSTPSQDAFLCQSICVSEQLSLLFSPRCNWCAPQCYFWTLWPLSMRSTWSTRSGIVEKYLAIMTHLLKWIFWEYDHIEGFVHKLTSIHLSSHPSIHLQ